MAARPLRLRSQITIPAVIDGGRQVAAERKITVEDYIIELMEANGTRAELCARAAGVGARQVHGWLAEGSRAEEKQQYGQLTRTEEQLLSFLLRTRAAHALWIHRHLEALNGVAMGGGVEGRIIEEVDPTQFERGADGQIVYGDDGRPRPLVLKRRVEQARTLPDAAALRWQLERLARDDDGNRMFAARVEVTGAEGGPVEVETREQQEERLYQQLLAFKDGLDAQRQRDEEKRQQNGHAE